MYKGVIHMMKSLSFVEGTCVWKPERTGDYEIDCAKGRSYAEELLQFIRSRQAPQVFGHVSRAMTDGGIFDGVETGFCSVIGIHICVSAESVSN